MINSHLCHITELQNAKIDSSKLVVSEGAKAQASRFKANADAANILVMKTAEADGFEKVKKAVGSENMNMYLFTSRWDGKKSIVEGGHVVSNSKDFVPVPK